MKVSTIQTFRKFSATPKRMGVIRPSAMCVPNVSRHLGWAIALVERLLRRVLSRAMRFESMILGRPTRTWIYRQQVLREGRKKGPLHVSQEFNSFHLHQSTSWISTTSQMGHSKRTLERISRYVVPLTLAPISSTLAGRGELPRRSNGSGLLETLTNHRSVRLTHEQRYSSLLMRMAPVDRDFTVRRAPLSVGTGAMNDAPERIVRQRLRVEDRSLTLESVSKNSTSSPFLNVPAFIERSWTPFKGKAAPHAERLEDVTQPSTAVNVAQITDAVLKQIDRRLVAARERMGKI